MIHSSSSRRSGGLREITFSGAGVFAPSVCLKSMPEVPRRFEPVKNRDISRVRANK